MPKNIFIIIFIFNISINAFSQKISGSVGEKFVKENIAIFPFSDASRGSRRDRGDKVTALIENTFVNMKRFNIVDRKNLDRYLKEMELQLAGLTDKEVIEMGKIYGYSKAVSGKITTAYASYNPGDEENGISPSLTGYIEIVLQIIDVSTTKILYSSVVSGSSYSIVTRYPSTATREAAIDNACYDLINNIQYRIRNIFKITLKIADVQKENIILLAGSEDGIKKGLKFKVLRQDSDIKLPSGNLITGEYKSIGTVRVDTVNNEYSIAKISRGRDIKAGDIVQETLMGNLLLGIFATYGSYNLKAHNKTYDSSISLVDSSTTGKLYIDIPKIDYSLGLHFKIGYNGKILAPNISAGIQMGDWFKTSWGLDFRFNLDININIYHEVFRLTITPYLGIASTFTTLGYISGGRYYTQQYTYAQNGAKIGANDLMFGIGALATLTYNITDTIGISLGAGYRFYTDPIRMKTYYNDPGKSSYDFNLPEKINTVNMTGIEGIFNIHFLL